MAKLKVGPLELEKIGDYPNVEEDPGARPPAAIQKKFPKDAERAELSPGGVWFSTVEETVTVVEARRKVKRSRRRVHWLVDGKVRAAKDLPGFFSIDFDGAGGFALLSADRGEILRLDASDGTIAPIALEGFTLGPASRLQGIHMLRDGRVLVHDVTDDGALLVAKVGHDKLTFVKSIPFEGDHTVVGGRVLVGGTDLTVIDLAKDTPKTLGSTKDLSCWMTWHQGPSEVRLYTHEVGAWDVRGFDGVR